MKFPPLEKGEPKYLAGKSGIEIAREIVFETMDKNFEKIQDFFKGHYFVLIPSIILISLSFDNRMFDLSCIEYFPLFQTNQ